MRTLLITIILRILLIISFAVHVFPSMKSSQLSKMLMNKQISYDFYVENGIYSNYYSIPFFILVLLNVWFTYFNSKKRNNGRILMKEIVIPEVNLDDDERESEITGKSAKVAFSVIIVFSFLLLSLFPMATTFFDELIAYSVFAVAALPIIGLLTYLITYKVLYSR
ncbi:hypothetical protein [Psychrobacillus soli]|uniref:Uncharacterized protein n=1 Tax=Psychrobacillus soli TaxID=1543965 RepID=A0A544TKI1_9BACI|nr:hypothetical protein [Psychrobacillus soli]TQR17949.1 hypothetical protein FG383_03615 [Psychrobacillus soli]